MEERTYNPLNEGYSGNKVVSKRDGYTGSSAVTTPPQTIKSLQSAIIKPKAPSN